jgi:hypothetical protein
MYRIEEGKKKEVVEILPSPVPITQQMWTVWSGAAVYYSRSPKKGDRLALKAGPESRGHAEVRTVDEERQGQSG